VNITNFLVITDICDTNYTPPWCTPSYSGLWFGQSSSWYAV